MYKRIWRLEARDSETDEIIFETSEHRITFEQDVGLAQGLATATIVVYNLADNEQKTLTRADLQATSIEDAKNNRSMRKVRVRLFTGYKDEVEIEGIEPQLIIEGFVMNATSVKKLPESLTYLYVIAFGSNLLINKFETFTTPGYNAGEKMTLQDVLERLCSGAGYLVESLDFNSLPDDMLDQEIIARTFKNSPRGLFETLNELSEEYCFSWGVRAAGLGFYPQLKDSERDSTEFNYLQENGERFVIDPVKVKGTPIAGMATLEIKHILDATLFPGTVIDVGEINGKSDNNSLGGEGIIDYSHLGQPVFYTDDVFRYAVFQYYMIHRVKHVGDTHGPDWQTTIVCKIPSSGITANEEV